jgi:endonuclease G
MRFAADLERRIPQWVTHVVSASDMRESTAPKRTGRFWADEELGTHGAATRDYKGVDGLWDGGHHKPSKDAVDWPSMEESNLLSNVALQATKFNMGPWRYLEDATRDLVKAYGPGTIATIVTGNLFQDDGGRPLEEREIQWWPPGQQRVAIPTHFYKAVLVRLPDGRAKTFAYLCPNSDEGVSMKLQQSVDYMRAHRVSVDALEARVGFDLFGSLSDRVERRIEADAAPTFAVPEPTLHTMAVLFFGGEAPEAGEEE